MIVSRKATAARRAASHMAVLTAAVLMSAAAQAQTAAPSQADWDKVVADAKAEGTLTIYTSSTADVTNAYVAGFKKAFPEITVNLVTLNTGPLTARLGQELKAGVHQADIVENDNANFVKDNAAEFKDATPALAPNVANIPANFVDGKRVETRGIGNYVGYNTDAVKKEELPKTWPELLDPKWQGKADWVDPRSSTGYLAWAKVMDDKFGDDFLVKLGKMGWTLTDSGSTASQQVAAGAKNFAVPVHLSHNQSLRESGAPIDNFELDPVVFTWLYISLLEKAPHPNAARVFLNWFLTPEAQVLNCGGANGDPHSSTSLPGVEGCRALPKEFVDSPVGIPADEKARLLGLMGLN